MMDSIDLSRIIIVPMSKGACPVCAVKHGKDEAHETRSLYYIMRAMRDMVREHG